MVQLAEAEREAKQKLIIQKKKKYEHLLLLIKLTVPLLILVIWEFASVQGMIRGTVLPAPSRIFETLWMLMQTGEIFTHISVSLWRIAQGFLIGGTLGVVIGILTGLFKPIDAATSLIIGLLRPIPNLAWVPILILWFGIGETSKIVVIAIASFWPVLLNVVDAIKRTDKKFLEVAKVLEKSSMVTVFQVILPSTLPSIFVGLRSGMDLAWRSVVGAELIAASAGIGYFMSYSREISQTDAMLASVLCIAFIGLTIDFLLRKLQSKILKWDPNFAK